MRIVVEMALAIRKIMIINLYLRQRKSFSSDASTQSYSPSQISEESIHVPSAQRNLPEGQVLLYFTHLKPSINFRLGGHKQ